jgi:hypothetical protein
MNDGLKAYAANKLVSLGSMAALIVGSFWLLGYTTTQWQLVLLFIIIFGYGHFLVGFYYQLLSFKKKPKPSRYVLAFIFLSVFSIALAQILFSYVGYAIALFIGFMYFLLHGLFNEQTLIQRQSGITVPLIYIVSLAVFVMSLLTYTIPDPTFFFSRTLQFFPVDMFTMVQSFKEWGIPMMSFKIIFWGGMALSFVILFYAWLKYRFHQLAILLASIYAVVIAATVFVGAMPYVYMYLVVVGYHFMTWFLFYWREMAKRGKPALSSFLGLHILLLSPFIFAGVLFFGNAPVPSWALTLIDYKFFTIATYVHITVSFMNDKWCQNLIDKVFNYFA